MCHNDCYTWVPPRRIINAQAQCSATHWPTQPLSSKSSVTPNFRSLRSHLLQCASGFVESPLQKQLCSTSVPCAMSFAINAALVNSRPQVVVAASKGQSRASSVHLPANTSTRRRALFGVAGLTGESPHTLPTSRSSRLIGVPKPIDGHPDRRNHPH